MKELELLLVAAKTVSNDKVVDSIAFAIKSNAIGNILSSILSAVTVVGIIYVVVKCICKMTVEYAECQERR